MVSSLKDGLNVPTEYGQVATGSPTGVGNLTQFGSDTAAGEAKWVVFGTAFQAAPKVFIGPAISGAAASLHSYVGTVGVGSFSWVGIPSGTSSTFNWIAAGSGQL